MIPVFSSKVRPSGKFETLMLIGETPSGSPSMVFATSTGPYFSFKAPSGSGASVMVTGIVYVRGLDFSPLVRVSVTLTGKVPALVGLPDSVPSSPNVNPSGRLSALYFAVTPSGTVPLILWLYSSPTDPGSNERLITMNESAARTVSSPVTNSAVKTSRSFASSGKSI